MDGTCRCSFIFFSAVDWSGHAQIMQVPGCSLDLALHSLLALFVIQIGESIVFIFFFIISDLIG